MSEHDVTIVLERYGLDARTLRTIEPLANAGGWSGSSLWRVTDPYGRELCLRRWPSEHPTADQLAFIQSVLSRVALEMPIVPCPLPTKDGRTFVKHGGRFWELTCWLKGQADYHENPGRTRLRAAMQALARFHHVAQGFEQGYGRASSVVDRQTRWRKLEEGGLALVKQSLPRELKSTLDERAVRLFERASRAFLTRRMPESLAAVPSAFCQPAIRDIHHDHVLFTGDEVTGIVDFGAMRMDTPLTDLARLVGSLAGDDQEARQFAFDAYAVLRPLSEEDRRLVDLLDENGLVLGAMNWLTWLYVERRDMGPMEPILRRLNEILTRLERLQVQEGMSHG